MQKLLLTPQIIRHNNKSSNKKKKNNFLNLKIRFDHSKRQQQTNHIYLQFITSQVDKKNTKERKVRNKNKLYLQ